MYKIIYFFDFTRKTKSNRYSENPAIPQEFLVGFEWLNEPISGKWGLSWVGEPRGTTAPRKG